MSVTVPVGFTVDYEKSFHMDKVELFEIVGVMLLKVPEFTLSTVSAHEFCFWETTDESFLLCPFRADFELNYVGLDGSGNLQLALDGKQTSGLDLVSGKGKSCLVIDYLKEISLSMIDDFSIKFDNYFSINISASTASISYSYGDDIKNRFKSNFICDGMDMSISDFRGLADYAERSLYHIGYLDLLESDDATELMSRKECRVLVLKGVEYLRKLVLGKLVEDVVLIGGSTLSNLRELYISKDTSEKVMVKILHDLITSHSSADEATDYIEYLNELVRTGKYHKYWSYLTDKNIVKDIDMELVLGSLDIIVY